MVGVASGVNALVMLPYIRWSQVAEEADAHHRTETIQGFQDLRLGVRYILSNTRFGPGERLFIGANLTLPTAPSYKVNPFAEGADTVEHRHFALGTGTTVVTLYGEWWHRSEFPWVTGLLARYTPSLTESAPGFQPGTRLEVDLHAIGQAYRLWKGFPYLILRLRWEGGDIWAGTPAPNSGGLFLEASAGLDLEFTEVISSVIRFTGPVWARLRGAQQTTRGINLTIRFTR